MEQDRGDNTNELRRGGPSNGRLSIAIQNNNRRKRRKKLERRISTHKKENAESRELSESYSEGKKGMKRMINRLKHMYKIQQGEEESKQ